MRLRQLLLRTDVQHNKHVSKRGDVTVFSSVVEPEPEPHHFGGSVAATRCGSDSRIKIFYPEPHHFDAAPQHLFFLNLFILNISFGATAASLTAPAAVKGFGSGRTEMMRLQLH
jgi:hypothetical protein